MALIGCSQRVIDNFIPCYFNGDTNNPSGIVPNGTAFTVSSLYIHSQVVVLNKKATSIVLSQAVHVIREVNGMIIDAEASTINDPENVVALTAKSGVTVTYTIAY